VDLSVLSKHDLRRLILKNKPMYVLAQVSVMTGQFAALPTGVNYRFLRTGPGLIPMGEFHGYTLAQVRTAKRGV
jgi:hypothetical protein